MLVTLTTLATGVKTGGGAHWALEPSTAYLFNTKNITSAKTTGTTDMEFRYVFEPQDRNSQPAVIRVTETLANTTTEANYDAPASSADTSWLTLNVYEDGVTSGSTTEYRIPQDAITFGETYTDTNITSKARIWVNEGGFGVKSYIVNHTVAAIETLAQAT